MNNVAQEWAACASLPHATQRRFNTPRRTGAASYQPYRDAEQASPFMRPNRNDERAVASYRPRAVPNNRPFRVGRTKSGREAARATRASEEAGQRAQGTAGDAAGIG
ncbi:hypothetical protein RE9427_10140 [Prescottella equi]|nr:hypothetical protein RE9427_10140 [Prescottella equi]